MTIILDKDRAANDLVGVSVMIILDKDRAANDFW